MNEKFYSTKEAAEFCNVSLRTIKNWLKSNNIKAAKKGIKSAKFYSEQQLIALLKMQKVQRTNENHSKSAISENGNSKSAISNSLKVQNSDTAKFRCARRTKNHANITNAVTFTDNLAIPTFKPYQYAMSLFQHGQAYLQGGIDTSNLKTREGKLFFEDPSGILKVLTEVELQNFKTKENVNLSDIGLNWLRTCYSILLGTYQEMLRQDKPLEYTIQIYVPDLLEYFGLKRDSDMKTIDKIINQMLSFQNVIGVLHSTRNGKPSKSYYAIFLFAEYNPETNTIVVLSPYLNFVVKNILQEAIKRDPNNKAPLMDKNGQPIPLPAHSFLIKPSIFNERNAAAVENVVIIIQVIEQAGDHIANIKANTIIERNPAFQQRLNESKNPNQLLKRVFKRTWELLIEQTHLLKVYKSIRLPNPKNPVNIPTLQNLNLVFSFPHDGKIKK